MAVLTAHLSAAAMGLWMAAYLAALMARLLVGRLVEWTVAKTAASWVEHSEASMVVPWVGVLAVLRVVVRVV